MSAQLPTDRVKAFVIASHGDLDTVKALLSEHPDLLNAEYDWGAGGLENGIGAAAHVGNRPIARFFLAQGVPPNICVSAMLGEVEQVRRFLDTHSSLANARGAHGIPVLFHAAMSGSVEIADLLHKSGCTEGHNFALHGAVSFGHVEMVRWLLSHGVTDVNVADYQNKTPLQRATELGHADIADRLRERGAAVTP